METEGERGRDVGGLGKKKENSIPFRDNGSDLTVMYWCRVTSELKD